MAREKRIDFQEAKEEEKVLEGRVIMVQTNKQVLGENEAYVIVSCNRRRIVIYESEILPLPFGQSIEKLIGSYIPFIILVYDKETNSAIGSNLIAENKKLNPIKESIRSGKEQKAKIIRILPHGAYLSINGVNVLMRNKDFSENGISVKDSGLREYQPIVVKYLRDTENGMILVEPTKKIKAEKLFDFDTLERGQLVIGRVCSVFPERVYVNISHNMDVMCEYPVFVQDLQSGEMAKVKLTKIDKEEERLRGIIVDIINR